MLKMIELDSNITDTTDLNITDRYTNCKLCIEKNNIP